MMRSSVKSSHIRAMGYDSSTKTLEVEFPNGSVYQYKNVPAETYGRIANAPSVGSAFSNLIRSSKFRVFQVQ